ncbi:ribonuclease MRP protein subunit rmp1 [Achaetomium macrosporum]|uniref:Ribonuclease MRP protein subunit rmp1 n=1 Tax=Achaetomium macrosporum TaxID=79813 RepID=A0AAN7CI15_9PEZI|nr:ribonuclease MRP protein subunit rmp1 [Achaetomium macrosporum]
MPSAKEPLPAALNPEVLNTAIASLSPALELLERFHHRNKNQHRLSKWWAQADMLRRHVRKMLDELEAGLGEAERVAKIRAKDEKKREGGKKSGQGKAENRGLGVVKKRAEYLRWRLGPGAYLAFTQLSADRQFAHLGLMLLGVLAQVDKAVAPLAPEMAAEATEEERAALLSKAQASGRASETAPDRGTTDADTATHMDMEMDVDMGVAVSREEIMASIEQDEQTAARAISPQRENLAVQAQTERDATSHQTSTTAGIKTDEAATKGTNNSSTSASAAGLAKPKKAKKERKREGDEFDDIFGSLDKSSSKKPPKKRKRKRGDEFDDIFGGLL